MGPDSLRSLVELGLTQNEAKAYRALLGSSPATAAEVARLAGIPRQKVYEALGTLERRGFCTVSSERVASYLPVQADVALSAWLRRREHERRLVAEHEEQLADELIRTLPRVRAHTREPSIDYLEALFGRARTSEALERVIDKTERTLDMIQQPPFLQPRSRWNVAEVAAARKGARVRVLYTPEAIRDRKRYVDLEQAGGKVRVRDAVPMKLLVRDGVEAMISLRDPATGEQGLTSAVIRHPDLVGPLQLLFNREWREGRAIRV